MTTPEKPELVEPGIPAMPNKPGAAGKADAGAVPSLGLSLDKTDDETAAALLEATPKDGSGKGLGAFIMILVAAMLLGGGFWIAKATTDPTASDEYVTLAAKAHETEQDRESAWSLNRTLEGEVASLTEGIELREETVKDREAALKTSEAALKTQEDGVKKREAAVSGAEKKKEAKTITDGTWVVGVDIEAGSYKANSSVGSSCYWAILASGTNGDDIINNDLPGGGLPSVTLTAGQDFKSSRCGSWTKQ